MRAERIHLRHAGGVKYIAEIFDDDSKGALSIEAVIRPAHEDDAREAVIQAAKDAYSILSLPSVKYFSGSQKLVDALDALKETPNG